MFERLRTPVAAFTPDAAAAFVTAVAANAVVPGSVASRLRLIDCVPPDVLPDPEPNWKFCRPPFAAAALAVFVTVMSVPTP